MKKILGGVLGLIGVLTLLSGTRKGYTLFLKIFPSLSGISQKTLLIVGIVFIFVSLALLKQKKNRENTEEVPIYEEDKVVAYRRVSRKKKKK